jgi:TPR repeat protein
MQSKATGTLPGLGCASVLFALALILLAPAAYTRDHTDCANSAGMKESVATTSQEDFAKAFQICKPLAEQGDADAQHKVGWMYFKAKGVPQDYAKALKWYQLAAEQGWVRSQMNLGSMYANGQGVTRDYAEAMKWYRKSADQGIRQDSRF